MKKKIIKLTARIALGGGVGFAYYYFIGCQSGSCAITSNPINSMAYGALVGTVWAWPFQSKKERKK